MKSSIITDIVRTDLCIGCGLCAALCPQEAIKMAWNKYGEYNPVDTTSCSTECGLCQKVCPFADNEENEDTIGKELYGNVPGIIYRQEIGYFLAAYVGYSEKHRPSSSSGGVATWLLERLLAEDIVDHVVCVTPTGNPERLFSFEIFDVPEGVRSGAGSAYYPVEMSGVIKQIIEVPGRYAIIGLPCFIKAVRLAQQRNAELRERIVITVGLVCGQMKSKHFTDYVADLAGVHGNVVGVRYRGKSPDHPASNYHFAFKTEDCEEHKIFWNEGISEAWINRWFTPKACNYCDDIFAECADVTCMDAWLPEYSKDSRGTSLVLVRSQLVEKVIALGQKICLGPILIERVVQSQNGVVSVKRQHLAYRLYLDQKRGLKVPKKRVARNKPKNPFMMQEVILKSNMSSVSRDAWAAGVRDAKSLRNIMESDFRRLADIILIAKFITFPVGTLMYIRKKLRK